MTNIPAYTSITVDWSKWMTLTSAEQESLRAKYRAIVKAESEASRATNYRAMNDTMAKAGRGQ